LGFLYKHKAGVLAVTGIQSMMTWLASDNILTGASMFSRDVANNVRFGNITPEQASEGLDEAQRDVNYAKRFIKTSATINPLLWPFYKLLATNAEATQRSIDLQKKLIGLE
jgi:hypothetical protein